MTVKFFETIECPNKECSRLCILNKIIGEPFCICDTNKKWKTDTNVHHLDKTIKFEDMHFTYEYKLDEEANNIITTKLTNHEIVYSLMRNYRHSICIPTWMDSYLLWSTKKSDKIAYDDWYNANLLRKLNLYSKYTKRCILYQVSAHKKRTSRGDKAWSNNKRMRIDTYNQIRAINDNIDSNTMMSNIINHKTLLSFRFCR